jgi:hypothetical protein
MKTYLKCLHEAACEMKATDTYNSYSAILNYMAPILQKAAEIYAEQSNSHKPVVMQAEGSEGAEGATVGNSAAGQSGSVSGSIISRCKDCGTIMQWPVSTTICDRCAEAPPEGALPR